jgi:DNA-binding NtrC family response regulator
MNQHSRNGGFNILVVDDDDMLLDTLEEMLSIKGYQVKTARNGIAGFEELQGGSFDMVVTDMNMPGMNGLELVEKIQTKNLNVPSILMTSLFSEKLRLKAAKMGVAASLEKPFSYTNLYSVIEKNLQVKSPTDSFISA